VELNDIDIGGLDACRAFRAAVRVHETIALLSQQRCAIFIENSVDTDATQPNATNQHGCTPHRQPSWSCRSPPTPPQFTHAQSTKRPS
jgi:hypothetical protein